MAHHHNQHVPPAQMDFLDPIIASSNRFADVGPYSSIIYHSEPHRWAAIVPWHFPQAASRYEEEAFLRKWFDDHEIHMQGGARGAGNGFRFLKQVCIARWWMDQEPSRNILADRSMLAHMLDPAATPETFFGPEDIKLYGRHILVWVVLHIQSMLRNVNVTAITTAETSSVAYIEHDAGESGTTPSNVLDAKEHLTTDGPSAYLTKSGKEPVVEKLAAFGSPMSSAQPAALAIARSSSATILPRNDFPSSQGQGPWRGQHPHSHGVGDAVSASGQTAGQANPINRLSGGDHAHKSGHPIEHSVGSMVSARTQLPNPRLEQHPKHATFPSHPAVGPQGMVGPTPLHEMRSQHPVFEVPDQPRRSGPGHGSQRGKRGRDRYRGSRQQSSEFYLGNNGNIFPPFYDHHQAQEGHHPFHHQEHPQTFHVPIIAHPGSSQNKASHQPGIMAHQQYSSLPARPPTTDWRTNPYKDHPKQIFVHQDLNKMTVEHLGPNDVTRGYIGAARIDVTQLVMFQPPSDQEIVRIFDSIAICGIKVHFRASSGHAYIQCRSHEDARRALSMHGTMQFGKVLNIEVAKKYWAPGYGDPSNSNQAIGETIVQATTGRLYPRPDDRHDGSWVAAPRRGSFVMPPVPQRQPWPDMPQRVITNPFPMQGEYNLMPPQDARLQGDAHFYNEHVIEEPTPLVINKEPELVIKPKKKNSKARKKSSAYSTDDHGSAKSMQAAALYTIPQATPLDKHDSAPAMAVTDSGVGTHPDPTAMAHVDTSKASEENTRPTPSASFRTSDSIPQLTDVDKERHASMPSDKLAPEVERRKRTLIVNDPSSVRSKEDEDDEKRQPEVSNPSLEQKTQQQSTKMPNSHDSADATVCSDAARTTPARPEHTAPRSDECLEARSAALQLTAEVVSVTPEDITPINQQAEPSTSPGAKPSVVTEAESQAMVSPSKIAHPLSPPKRVKVKAAPPAKTEKAKGPSQTESFSMFGRKKKESKPKAAPKSKLEHKAKTDRVSSAPAPSTVQFATLQSTSTCVSSDKKRSQCTSLNSAAEPAEETTSPKQVALLAEGLDTPSHALPGKKKTAALGNLFGLLGSAANADCPQTPDPKQTPPSKEKRLTSDTTVSISADTTSNESNIIYTPESGQGHNSSVYEPTLEQVVSVTNIGLPAKQTEEANLVDPNTEESEAEQEEAQHTGLSIITTGIINASANSSPEHLPSKGPEIDTADDSSRTMSAGSQASSEGYRLSPAKRLAQIYPQDKQHLIRAPRPRNAHKRRVTVATSTKSEDSSEVDVSPDSPKRTWFNELVVKTRDSQGNRVEQHYPTSTRVALLLASGSEQQARANHASGNEEGGITVVIDADAKRTTIFAPSNAIAAVDISGNVTSSGPARAPIDAGQGEATGRILEIDDDEE